LLLVAVLLSVACDDDDVAAVVQPQPPGPSIVRLVPAKTVYRVGETVEAVVVVDNADDVGSIPFHLTYDPDVLQFVPPGIEGTFMSGDGTATAFLVSDSAAQGELVVGLSRLGAGPGASGSGTLATFHFSTLDAGPCGFDFTAASVKDPEGRTLPAAFHPAEVSVEP
jgi:hypothetical protein